MERYENFLSKKDWQYVVNKTFGEGSWKFSGSSGENRNKRFWYMELMDDPFFTQTLLKQIEKQTGQKFTLQRVYANGHTFALGGEWHKDVESEEKNKYLTFLYYPCLNWDKSWGGQTLIQDHQQGLMFQYPTPNLGILFDSTDLHYAEEPTRNFFDLRVTVAFKLTKK